MMKTIFILLIILALFALSAYLVRDHIIAFLFRPAPTTVPVGVTEEKVSQDTSEPISVLATHLDIPWEIAFIGEGIMLVTEREGTLKMIGEQESVFEIPNVAPVGEGGLLGMALHPDFSENGFLYLYMTYRQEGSVWNKVVRYVFDRKELSDPVSIVEFIPGGSVHNGGRIRFGPDRFLYIGTGDAGHAEQAQDIDSLAGKILRVRDDGSVPQDNPFGNEVWSLGHRNVQGIAWDGDAGLWATEHGPSGRDEINIIERGGNYGWPVIRGNEQQEGMEWSALHSGSETWAPSGMDILNESIFFGGLRSQSLFEIPLREREFVLHAHFPREFGRIRVVKAGPDGFLYIGTNNTDGRGSPRSEDDVIMRIHPDLFE